MDAQIILLLHLVATQVKNGLLDEALRLHRIFHGRRRERLHALLTLLVARSYQI